MEEMKAATTQHSRYRGEPSQSNIYPGNYDQLLVPLTDPIHTEWLLFSTKTLLQS